MEGKAEFIKPTAKELKGLKDRGIVTINCEDCGKALLSVQITSNNEDLKANDMSGCVTKVMCMCGICGGMSYIHGIDGLFHVGVADDSLYLDYYKGKEKPYSENVGEVTCFVVNEKRRK